MQKALKELRALQDYMREVELEFKEVEKEQGQVDWKRAYLRVQGYIAKNVELMEKGTKA